MPEFENLIVELPSSLMKEFSKAAEAIGIPVNTAVILLIRRFIEKRGFPFEVEFNRSEFNWDDSRIIKTKRKDGKLLMPAAWRDEDDQEFWVNGRFQKYSGQLSNNTNYIIQHISDYVELWIIQL